MGWREEEEKARKMKAVNDSRQEELDDFDLDLGSSSRNLNGVAIFGNATGEDKLPGIEPEDTWIRDLERIPLKLEALDKLIGKCFRGMDKYVKFNGKSDKSKLETIVTVFTQYRPSIMSAMGALVNRGGD